LRAIVVLVSLVAFTMGGDAWAERTTTYEKDVLGNITIHRANGAILTGRTDALGNTVFHDQRGRSLRCNRNTFGAAGTIKIACHADGPKRVRAPRSGLHAARRRKGF